MTITRPGAHRSTSSPGHASPPTPTRRSNPSDENAPAADGVWLSTLTCSLTSKAWKSSGERRHRVGHHHQPSTEQQGTPDLPHREVERIGVKLRPHLSRRQLQADVQRVEQPGDVVVGDRHPLGHPGGARGVDDVGDVIRGRPRQRRAGLVSIRGSSTSMTMTSNSVEPVGQLRGGDRGRRRGVGEHEPDPVRR